MTRSDSERAKQASYDALEQRVQERTAKLQQEVAERRHAEQMLRETEERFRLFSEATFEGIVISDQGRFLEVNAQLASMFGYAPSEMIGMSAMDVVPPDMVEMVRERITSGYEQPYESKGLRKDGTTFPIEVQAKMVPYKGGVARITAIRDLSARRELEHQLRQSQKMEAIGELTAGIAHNFNNRLLVILASLEEAKSDDADPEMLALGEAAALRAAEMVEQLMIFSRSNSATQQEHVQIPAILRQALAIGQAFDSAITIVDNLPHHLPSVLADANRLEQVFLVLLLNARDAVEASSDPAPTIELTAGMKDGHVEVCVRDNGVGMSPETLSRVFDPFFTTKDVGKGTGLGLSVAFGIVEEHNGQISCDSHIGVGTTFCVRLPIAQEITAGSQEAAQPDSTPGGDETILLIDDEEDVRIGTSRMLQKAGYRVLLADNGRAGLAEFEQASQVHLILLDLSMPHMSGQEFLQRLRAIDGDVPVLLSTGQVTLDEDELPVQGILRKPYRTKQALQEIRTLLDAHNVR